MAARSSGTTEQPVQTEADLYADRQTAAGLAGQDTEARDARFLRLALESEPSLPESLSEPARSLGNERMLGAYRLREEIGRGGMGVIYRAVHARTSQVVALKTVLPQYTQDTEILARFEREAQTVAKLSHPHIIPIYEVGNEADGTPHFSMMLAGGGSLHHLKANYRGRWRQIAVLLGKVARAIHHAHTQGVLHRDLKPGNILFDGSHEPLVTDFGLAKWFTGKDDLTQTRAILGTPHYIAPEQAQGRMGELTAATDVYSLGAILFELLTGQPPFTGDNPLDVFRQVTGQVPPRPRSLAPTVPRALERICLQCLEKQPENRYQCAGDLADDLDRWLNGEQAIAPSFRWRPRWMSLRQMVIPGASALAVLVAVVWAAKSAWNHRRAGLTDLLLAVSVDDLNQGAEMHSVAASFTNELERCLGGRGGFHVRHPEPSATESEAKISDPVAYGHEANAPAVLAGSVRCEGDQIRLVVRLVRTEDKETLWQHSSSLPAEGTGRNLPGTAKDTVDALSAKLATTPKLLAKTPSRVSVDAKAFYTKGRELASRPTQTDLGDAITLIQKAIRLDPNYVEAQVALAQCYWMQAYMWEDADKLSPAEDAASKVLVRHPHSSAAHRILGSCDFKQARYSQALGRFWNALEDDPQSALNNFWVGATLREMGHPDQAEPWLRRAARLDPVHGSYAGALGETLMLSSSDEEAEEALQRGLELDPDQADTLIAIAVLRLWQHRPEEARRFCAAATRRFPDYRRDLQVQAMIELFQGDAEQARRDYERLRAANSYEQGWESYGAINPSSALAYLAKERGEPEQSCALASEAMSRDQALLDRYPNNSRILHDAAATYLMMGDREKAMQGLQSAIASGWVEHRSTLLDPRFRSLANDARFSYLLSSTFPKAYPATEATPVVSAPAQVNSGNSRGMKKILDR